MPLTLLPDNETFHHRSAVSRSATIVRKFSRLAAQCLLATVALLLLTVIFYRLHLNLATASLLYVIVVVLLSRFGSFASSAVTSLVAVLCLAHLAPPSSFRVDNPLDVVAIAAFLITSFVIASLVSRVRKQAEKALSSVRGKVIEAEERERYRIAHDLHEDIGQRITLLVIEIEQLKADSLNTDLQSRIDALLKENLELLTDVKTLAHELYSPRLEYLDMAGVMNTFCTDFAQKRRVGIDFTSAGSPSVVPRDISLCLFRVLQEALLNGVQHSGTGQFHVQLNGTSDEIHLTVSDCGAGFNLETARTSQGLGLHRMQERLKLVSGGLTVDSQPKRGTTIHARVPLSFGGDSMRVAG